MNSILGRLLEEYQREGISAITRSVRGYYRNISKVALTRGVQFGLRTFFASSLVGRQGLEWDAGKNVYYFGEPVTTNVRPKEVDSYPEAFRTVCGEHHVRAPFVCELKDAELYGPDCVARTNSGGILLDASGVDSYYLAETLLRYAEWTSIIETIDWLRSAPTTKGTIESTDRPIFPLARTRASNYYHWTTEFLPKVRALRHYEAVTGEEPIVLIDSDPPGWKLESLELVGIDLDRCREWKWDQCIVGRLVLANSRIRTRYALIPSRDTVQWAPIRLRSPHLLPPPQSDLAWVREQVLSTVGDVALDPSSRVYISRSDAQNRQVKNEPAVMEVLESRGFESYALSELSVAEQATLFDNADLVVAPHGAGLTNLVYADDVSVVELFPSNLARPYFFMHAIERGFDYEYMHCDLAGTDIVVDIEQLREVVDAKF